jgi:hypothetical protein
MKKERMMKIMGDIWTVNFFDNAVHLGFDFILMYIMGFIGLVWTNIKFV